MRTFLLAMVFLSLLGCGRKGPVKAPEFARPAVIADLRAENGEREITLSWSRPSQYADGARMTDLGEFQIERASGDAPAFEPLAVLPIADRERVRQIKRFRFADRGVVSGDRYRYRVVSSTVDGYASAPSNVVEIVREPRQVPTATPATRGEER